MGAHIIMASHAILRLESTSHGLLTACIATKLHHAENQLSTLIHSRRSGGGTATSTSS
jgi:hypothetical protein